MSMTSLSNNPKEMQSAVSAANPDLSRRQTSVNLMTNLLSFGLTITSGFILTPYWIKSLGIDAYGLVPLTNNLTHFLALIALVVSSSVSRFITVEVSKGNFKKANRIFNTSLWANSAAALSILFVGSVAAVYATHLILVPPGYEHDASLVLMIATLAFSVSTVSAPFAAAIFCANRVDINGWVAIAGRALQIAISIFLVTTIYARPGALMIASLASAVLAAVASVYFWRKYMPWAYISGKIDWGILRQQTSYGSWAVINQIGSALYLQIDLILVNRVMGPIAGGQYAALSQWPVMLRSLGVTTHAVFAPRIMHQYARNDIDGLVRSVRSGIRVIGLMLTLPVAIICGLAKPLLVCWLGTEYGQFRWILVLMVIHLAVNTAVFPLFVAQQAANRIRLPAIVTIIFGVCNVGLATILTMRWGMYGVAASGAVLLTAKNLIFSPLYVSHIIRKPWHVFFPDILQLPILACVLSGAGLALAWAVDLQSWGGLIVGAMGITFLYLPLVWVAAMNSSERKMFISKAIELANVIFNVK